MSLWFEDVSLVFASAKCQIYCLKSVMANDKEEEKELESEFTLVQRKNMRRGKPPQQIYKPGSGKLRKSNIGSEEFDSHENLIVNSGPYTVTSSELKYTCEPNILKPQVNDIGDFSQNQKRNKKPEQQFYVPKVVAQAREQTYPTFDMMQHKSDRNIDKRSDGSNRSKRYSTNRRNDRDTTDEWRDKSPPCNRGTRQGSEPRGNLNGANSQRYRDRDTRSVEPSGVSNRNYNSEKIQSKPPSGRRHSTTGLDAEKRQRNLDNLPPRFRKKYLAEMPHQEENWDGSSLTFQQHYPKPNPNPSSSFHQMGSYNTMPPGQNFYNQNVHSHGYNTLPHRPRGRGRFQHDSEFVPGSGYRQPSQDLKSSRPHTPPPNPRRPLDSNSRPLDSNSRPLDSNSRPQTPIHFSQKEHHIAYNGSDHHGDQNFSGDHNYGNQRYSDRGENSKRSEARQSYGGDTGRDGGNYHQKRDNHNRRRDDGRYGHNRRDRNRRDRGSSVRDFPPREANENTFEIPPEDDWDNCQNNNGAVVKTSDLSESLTAQLSPVSPPTPQESLTKPVQEANNFTVLDWNEEVELNDKLEAEALSDALTRSSSVNSLHEISTRSMPASINSIGSTKKSKRKTRRRSKHRSDSHGRDKNASKNRATCKNSSTSIDTHDGFKTPQEPYGSRRRRDSRDKRDASFERFHTHSRNPSRDCSFDRSHSVEQPTNWREEILRSRQNSEKDNGPTHSRKSLDRSRNNSEREEHKLDTKKAGVLVLPPKTPEPSHQPCLNTQLSSDYPRCPDVKKSPAQQKKLFDPNNPNKPIVVKSPGSRVAIPGFSDDSSEASPPQMYTTDQFGNLRPKWYDESTEAFRSYHFPNLLRDIKKADTELQYIINNGLLLVNYDTVDSFRVFLKQALEYLLCKALKFCQSENVEQHLWKLLYYNIIEVTRKAIVLDPENKHKYKEFLLYLIDEGTKYFEKLIKLLEETYKFRLSDFLGSNSLTPQKGLGFVGLALVSAQKLLLFLGDLARYREQVNETTNYGKCRQWYIKSQEINPKNGKPYNQLAILAVCSRRKLDAVYYYMRSLMSSNPVPSAKENLISLFDETRKKYEQSERKRREERLERHRMQMKEKESQETSAPNSLRKETWIHPEGGRRFHRTTKALQEENKDSEEEDLAALSSVDVNKRFVISYLHVHGKLITKIGMESFQEAAMQMLKEFRALLQHSPVPLPCNRFLQLLALNMFAIESTQLKDPDLQTLTGYRSELQERALVISLQMFNLILERCISILEEHISTNKELNFETLPLDANVLLPSIKIWCDWMLCHTSVWNPPPSTQDFKVGSPGDAWSRLGILMGLLEKIDQRTMDLFVKEQEKDYELVRLPEDVILSGFTPLMFNSQETTYAPGELEPESAQLALRLSKILFFGTVYLCGLEPPVLKLEIEDELREYVSVVCTSNSRDSPPNSRELVHNNDVLLESFSGDEEDNTPESLSSDTPSEIRDLLTRKVELERKKRNQELHRQRVMQILSQSVVSVHIEIRPRNLVPDTNCFIDHLHDIHTIAQSHCYTLMVPIVVLSELEGLAKGGNSSAPSPRSSLDPHHVRRVAQSAKSALEFLKKRQASVKCVTTKGAIIASTAFSTEDDTTWDSNVKNDDKILITCIELCKGHKEMSQESVEGEPRHLVREVVLLTEDRNLRVKAYARDVPVRELPDFMRWAGLG